MWSETVFSQMARLSFQCSSIATFTSAVFVKRGLRNAGFEVEKISGFGRKREMLIGRFSGQNEDLKSERLGDAQTAQNVRSEQS